MKHRKKSGVWSKIQRKPEWYVVIALILIAVYFRTDQNLLNYPDWITYTVAGVCFLVANVIFFKHLLTSFKDGVIEFGLYIVQMLVLSFGVSAILLLCFNLWIIFDLEQSKVEAIEVPVIKVTTYSQNRCFYYKYEDDVRIYYDYKPIMEQAKNSPEDYKVIFEIKQGKLGIFKVLSWHMMRR
ncbi:hypothetical protein [Fulvivirga ligni]|uniref:hypothetical protein n=1 Tax=Fulvivirga ligni TaxID=2904246 RepID=UPI001F2E4AF0|nr:hypothetical protein [Fulvivirga ligni]UII21527.1 hypothetical protein LVD16_27240 [Fulvivirga ligni]